MNKFWPLVLVGLISLILLYLMRPAPLLREEIKAQEEAIFEVGDIRVDANRGRIIFSASIAKEKGWAQFLIHTQGYNWLKEEAAVVSEAKLADLQKAIALIDRQLWDDLWYRNPASSRPLPKVFLQWDKNKIAANNLISENEEITLGDLIFLGSPYFDYAALQTPPGIDCRLCPLFALEEKALREAFIRESGESGYQLDTAAFPKPGTGVKVIIVFNQD